MGGRIDKSLEKSEREISPFFLSKIIRTFVLFLGLGPLLLVKFVTSGPRPAENWVLTKYEISCIIGI